MDHRRIIPNRVRLWLAPTAASLLMVLAAGCASGGTNKTSNTVQTPKTTTVSPATLGAGQPVPAPAGEQVLRLQGRIGTTNVDGGLALDLATLERLGLVSFEVYEPFQKRRMGFQGIALAKVLDLARLDPAVPKLHMVALDDYTVDLTVADARREGVMLATRAGDGSPLRVEDGGPIRIVFLDGTPGGGDEGNWIWSLARLEAQ